MRYRKIDPRIWKDEKFISLGSFFKLVIIYCLTTPQSNRIGIFNFSPSQAAEDLETLPETFLKGFKKVCEIFNWRYDEKYRVLYIPKWWKYNKPENPNVLKNCLQDLHEIPNSPLKEEFKSNLDYLPETFHETFSETFAEGLPKPSPKRMGDQEQEQEQEQDISKDGIPSCPHKGIVSLYHEILPELAKVKDWTEERQKALRARWREDKGRQSLEWWKGYFEHVRESGFLMGDNGNRWQPNLEWLVKKSNFIKVCEGQYHNG
jgi:hypothetical protein